MKTFVPSAPARFNARAMPAAAGLPWPDGPVLNFRNRVFPDAGEAAPPAERKEVLPRQDAFGFLRVQVFFVTRFAVHDPEGLVEEREDGVHHRDRVARPEDEAVGEPPARIADVPAHDAAEEGQQKRVHLGARSAGMSALPVVQCYVQKLIRQILRFFQMCETGPQFFQRFHTHSFVFILYKISYI